MSRLCSRVTTWIELTVERLLELVTAVVESVCRSVVERIETTIRQLQERWAEASRRVCSWLPWPLSALCRWVTELVRVIVEVVTRVVTTVLRTVCELVTRLLRAVFRVIETIVLAIPRLLCPPERPTAPPPVRPVLVGFADLHAHLMGHLAYGGRFLWGRPYDPTVLGAEGIRGALGWCTPYHGVGGLSLTPEPGHLVGGYPEFDGWPKFTSSVHQAAYVDWVKRAWQGGLRLVCMLAVNNELLAEKSGSPRDDATSIDEQLRAMRDMVAYVDRQSGGPGRGWLQIATTPAEARRVIRAGKLAVVLGVEVDSLGNWRTAADLPREDRAARQAIRAELERLYDLGVRQITPVHLTDNAFGGCAVYNRWFDLLNFKVTGRHYEVEDAFASGVRYRLDEDAGDFWGNAQRAIVLGSWGDAVAAPEVPGGHANQRGLSEHGWTVLEEMRRLGMLIDIDHMSQKATDATLRWASDIGYPVMSSHTGFRDLAFTHERLEFKDPNKPQYGTSDVHKVAHESLKTADQIRQIRDLGGMIAPILNQGDLSSAVGRIEHDCAGSSTSWAQAYLYALEQMEGRRVAMGTDINGMAGLPGPRFATSAAHRLHGDDVRKSLRRAQADAQGNGVRYDSPVSDYRAYRFESTDVYEMEERDVWEAIAIHKSGTHPDAAEQPTVTRTPWQRGKIANIAKGLGARSEGDLLPPRPFAGNAPWEQRAAFLVKAGRIPAATDEPEVRRLHPVVKRIWDKWHDMEGDNEPLSRSFAGRRDFDVNLDGVAHYGLLPDFIQDLMNLGLTEEDLSPLAHSAEDYVEMWERCERSRP